jgi:hypothetical protein
MRIVAVLGLLVAASLMNGCAGDRQGAFCVFDVEYTNCSYPTIQACRAAASGAGGLCRPNPKYDPERRRR